MAKQYAISNRGTRVDVTGLNADQVAKVTKLAQGTGASKAAALVNVFRNQAQNPNVAGYNPNGPANTTNPNTPNIPGASNLPGNGNNVNINSQTPIQNQNIQSPINDKTGQINSQQVLDQVHAPVGVNDLQGDVNQARNSAYSYITQHYNDQKNQELQAKKQELAEQGIPIDTSPNSLYSKSIAQIDQKYQALDDQAHNQAIQSGNSILGTEGQVSTAGYTAFMNGLLGSAGLDASKYKTDAEKQAALAEAKARQTAANAEMIKANKYQGSNSSGVIIGGGFQTSNG